ncbi:hypothetical protein BT93_L4366, partial [Corymbia citriodora subsp. variegata]
MHPSPIQNREDNVAPPACSWASVARTTVKGYNLPFIQPSSIDGRQVVKISEETLDTTDPKWFECLVGYLVGKKLPFKLVETALKNAWGSKLVELKANDQGFFFFRIPDAEFQRKTLDEGPLTVTRVPLILQQWSPLLELKKNNQMTIPVWIRLRNIPYALWSVPGIGVIASAIGRPLYVNQRTEHMDMILCTEYEWRPLSCQTYGVFGHRCHATDLPAPFGPGANPPEMAVVQPVKDATAPYRKASCRKVGDPKEVEQSAVHVTPAHDRMRQSSASSNNSQQRQLMTWTKGMTGEAEELPVKGPKQVLAEASNSKGAQREESSPADTTKTQ